MQASIHEQIEKLARVAVGADAGDLPALVGIVELAEQLGLALEAVGQAELVRTARLVRDRAESVVLRETEAPEEALREMGEAIERLQQASAAPGASGARAPAAPVDAALLTAWIAGCEGMLARLEEQLLAVERNPADAEAIGEIRRAVHTLKGECGVLGLQQVQRLCHEAETLMDQRQGAGRAVAVDVLLALTDWLRDYVAKLGADSGAVPTGHAGLLERIVAAQSDPVEGATERPAEPAGEGANAAPAGEENVAEFVCEAREHLAGAEGALLALERDPGNRELIDTVFRAFHTIKGVAGFLQLASVVRLAHGAEHLLEGARSGEIMLGRAELGVALTACDMLLRLLAEAGGGPTPAREELEEVLRALEAATQAGAATSSASGASAAPPGGGQGGGGAPAGGEKRPEQTVRVSTERMDHLVTMVGELVIAQQMVAQDAGAWGGAGGLGARGERLRHLVAHAGKIVGDLQEVSLSLRMVSLRGTFQRMARLVRDIALKTGKQIVCVAAGEDVELDRSVVEEITDPLVHMIRNACDHGIESGEERVGAGKERAGCISLKASHSGGSIVLEIGDDGRGLNREKIAARGRSTGLLDPGTGERSIPDARLLALIFLPGFTTADQVTDMSGRGVGLDVVRRNIEALRGKVEVRSTPGQGTTFLLRLPLTLAIIDGMVVRAGGERYVVPTAVIDRALRAGAEDVGGAGGGGEHVRVGSELLAVHRLARVLGESDGGGALTEGLLVVVEAGLARCALLVDELVGPQQVVIKNLGMGSAVPRGVAGGAILGDGRVALIVDVAGIAAPAGCGA